MYDRELHEAVVLAGFVVDEAVARGLKHVLRHARPVEFCATLNVCDSYGMPSSHTQCAFFAVAVHAYLAGRYWQFKSSGTRTIEALEVLALSAAAVAVAYSRVYLGYHATDQVRWHVADGRARVGRRCSCGPCKHTS